MTTCEMRPRRVAKATAHPRLASTQGVLSQRSSRLLQWHELAEPPTFTIRGPRRPHTVPEASNDAVTSAKTTRAARMITVRENHCMIYRLTIPLESIAELKRCRKSFNLSTGRSAGERERT